MKQCAKCGRSKPLSSYYSHATSPDRRGDACMTCVRSLAAERAKETPPGRKWCPGCDLFKPLEEFSQHKGRGDGRTSYCKPCYRAYSNAYYSTKAHDQVAGAIYGLKRGEYAERLEAQDGVCAVCHRPERLTFRGVIKRLAVDHDHRTGAVRALLCHSCNAILGYADDDPVLLLALVDYLCEDRPEFVRAVLKPLRERPACGTYAGCIAHYRRKEPACDLCKEAKRLDEQGRRASVNA